MKNNSLELSLNDTTVLKGVAIFVFLSGYELTVNADKSLINIKR